MRVVVTGLGSVNPLGLSLKQSWPALVSGSSGLISTRALPDYESGGYSSIPSKVVGKVMGFDPSDFMSKSEAKRLAPFAQYGVVAANEAISDANLSSSVDPTRIGVAVGSGIGSFADAYENSTAYEARGYRGVSPLFVPRLLANMCAGNISISHGFQGPIHAVSTACATGAHAIGDAYNFIVNGYADVMVCGGAEAAIHPVALAGFARARSVSTADDSNPAEASRPFDGARAGFVLSEGAGVLVLESEAHARKRGIRDENIYAEILGYGLSGDANHITAPLEDGGGAQRSMSMALSRAGVDGSMVDYVNAHATSTVLGDRAENNALYKLFEPSTYVGSNKSALGHLLGAAGAVESIFTILALKNQVVPPTATCITPGGHPEDDASRFVFRYPNVATPAKLNYAICNSFGFGGVNATLLFRKWE
ncbi:3-oxoacyl-[acyl-carrier-protein] synthase homolog [Diutina catenulata]